jgi:glycosyltransferase involved in cell wall biosynthesis
MSAAEAMAAGVPVVVADRGALPETVGNAGLRFDPDRPDDLVRALTAVVSSPDRQQQMAEAGLAQVRRFTWAHTAGRMREAWHLAVEHRMTRG